MAKVKKYKFIVARDSKIGLKEDGTPKKEVKKSERIYLTLKESKIYKQNNIIE